MYTDEQRHIVWCHKFLKTPLNAMSEKDKILIENYEEESSLSPTYYKENLYGNNDIEIKNQILKNNKR